VVSLTKNNTEDMGLAGYPARELIGTKSLTDLGVFDSLKASPSEKKILGIW
jgi:hypothetical protein